MSKYFLIESRTPFDSPEVQYNYELASNLANCGHEVTLFLVENGVLAARSQAYVNNFNNLEKVTILADDFSLTERAIETSELSAEIKISHIGILVDAMAEGQKVMWL